MLKTLRFLHAYSRFPAGPVVEEEVDIPQAGGCIPATYLRPRLRGPLPGWIVLHGITVPGRNHPLMRRIVHALAATGAAVVIPEIEPWRRLRLDIPAGNRAIQATVDWMEKQDDIAMPATLLGFSFGATQALTASTLPGVSQGVGRVVAFGGYCDFASTLRFMMTGLREGPDGGPRVAPDPYGRWIAAANYLLDIPGFEDMTEVTDSVRLLAIRSGEVGVFAGDPIYDPLKAKLRAALPGEQLEVWDLIANPSNVQPPLEPALLLAERLAAAAQRRHPELDPRPLLARVERKVILAHGFDDRLIPCTEMERLREALPPAASPDLSITRLFSHSAQAGGVRIRDYPREAARYFDLLNRAL